MRKSILVSFLFLLNAAADRALAELTVERPTFNTSERELIHRDSLLSDIVERDPWLVRQILDLYLRSDDRSRSANVLPSVTDLKPLAVGTAQVLAEWLDLLKRAREEQASVHSPIESSEALPRSALGSLELLDMVKAAKHKKETTK